MGGGHGLPPLPGLSTSEMTWTQTIKPQQDTRKVQSTGVHPSKSCPWRASPGQHQVLQLAEPEEGAGAGRPSSPAPPSPSNTTARPGSFLPELSQQRLGRRAAKPGPWCKASPAPHTRGTRGAGGSHMAHFTDLGCELTRLLIIACVLTRTSPFPCLNESIPLPLSLRQIVTEPRRAPRLRPHRTPFCSQSLQG